MVCPRVGEPTRGTLCRCLAAGGIEGSRAGVRRRAAARQRSSAWWLRMGDRPLSLGGLLESLGQIRPIPPFERASPLVVAEPAIRAKRRRWESNPRWRICNPPTIFPNALVGNELGSAPPAVVRSGVLSKSKTAAAGALAGAPGQEAAGGVAGGGSPEPTRADDGPTDPDLAQVLAAWPTLPEAIRRAVMALVGVVSK